MKSLTQIRQALSEIAAEQHMISMRVCELIEDVHKWDVKLANTTQDRQAGLAQAILDKLPRLDETDLIEEVRENETE